jgi:hypothetical protein
MNQHIEYIVEEFRKQIFRSNMRIEDWLRTTLTTFESQMREQCDSQKLAGYHLAKYIKKPEEVRIGMIAAFCCDHDAFVIKTGEQLRDVVENLTDEEEDKKYMVVRFEDAHLLCGCYDTVPEMVNCKLVRALQELSPSDTLEEKGQI